MFFIITDGSGKATFTFEFYDTLSSTAWHSSATEFVDYGNSAINTTITDNILPSLPFTPKEVNKVVAVPVKGTTGVSTTKTISSKLWLPSLDELNVTNYDYPKYRQVTEGSIYEYYQDTTHIPFKSSRQYWTRSILGGGPLTPTNMYVYYAEVFGTQESYSKGGYIYISTSTNWSFAPAFCL